MTHPQIKLRQVERYRREGSHLWRVVLVCDQCGQRFDVVENVWKRAEKECDGGPQVIYVLPPGDPAAKLFGKEDKS